MASFGGRSRDNGYHGRVPLEQIGDGVIRLYPLMLVVNFLGLRLLFGRAQRRDLKWLTLELLLLFPMSDRRVHLLL